jgi:hypothetical protein
VSDGSLPLAREISGAKTAPRNFGHFMKSPLTDVFGGSARPPVSAIPSINM